METFDQPGQVPDRTPVAPEGHTGKPAATSDENQFIY